MTNFLGEYNCKLDGKNRFILPAGLKKQIPTEAKGQFVINRGIEKCLVLYPRNEWDKITEEINKLNPYKKENRRFMRYFFRGATELQLDGSDRLLLPQQLQDYADIEKEIVLFAHTNKIEIWAKAEYEDLMTEEPEDFAELAEKVMGNATERNEEGSND